MVRTSRLTLEIETRNAFTDVPEKFWAAPYIAAGNKAAYMTGYPDDTFRTSKPITRAEGV